MRQLLHSLSAGKRSRGVVHDSARHSARSPMDPRQATRNRAPEPAGGHTCACGGTCPRCAAKHHHDDVSGARDDGITIGAKGHPLETEAERIANQVVEAPVTAAGATETLRVQLLNGFAGADGDHAPDSVERVLSGPGRSLDPALRQDMEQRFGHPLTRVRVHADAAAAQSAQDVDARAYTVGDDIVFGAGQYAPDTNQGRRLIAHEVTHVLQQSGSNGLVQRAGGASTRRTRRADAASGEPGRGTGSARLRHSCLGRVLAWADLPGSGATGMQFC